MKNKNFKQWALFSAVLISLTISACKKNKNEPAPVTPPVATNSNVKQTITTNRLELSNDSLFLYAKEIYFWNESLPSYDTYEPRKYNILSAAPTKSITQVNLENNLFNLVKSSGSADFVSGSSFPKYSYIQDINNANPTPTSASPNDQASVDLEGNGNDIGIYRISAVGQSATEYRLYISAVFENGPAAKQGLTRGAYITHINGTPIGTVDNGSIAASEVTLINSTIYGNPASIQLLGVKTDGNSFDVTLNKTSYKSSPIYKSNVLTAGSKKIGYLAYARFSNSSNSIAALNAIFEDFASKGVTDLIVDLRYNGGGYVSTAEHLVNLIAPSTASGVMYIEHYNNNLKNRKTTDASILKNQPLLDANDKVQLKANGTLITYADIDYSIANNTNNFAKKGGLGNVKNIVFLVSGGTASASELVINSLRPQMTVTLVGKTTYGKPVGFFPIKLENRYDVYLSLFETKNALGVGGYYNGMPADIDGGSDLGNYDFGNPLDGYLAKALTVLAPGVNVTAIASTNRLSSSSGLKTNQVKLNGNFDDEDKDFVGMIETRHSIKK
ncbi:S41 family peptidase [Pedobacter sp. JCM 36344]|uniref:S41 family peptidase n=1 Tax=Pedobacter sp. JCM 36344 TaxID=3374280 RepID=UPI00397A171C